ncbi:MAG TPA: 23S rRNA (guanine(1835)-N(2))-methyltransferase RlmG [Erwinia persicina]|uniref:23S rRNA (guanine(1835)-N(2))-methyltransferase RlmG n=1 Tax=Erwinia persicina TaxID=55211 RepID=UPI000786ADCE|nr:23S rRNA (guanine(1835)-N(2))-methyltransferase RlmG [Erwinia persicina]AXU96545.1 23S rRNA (guanine(1835)-N(2))-methyltransferase RlmG [Erwinia persicina]MBC3944634.1 23S rRNA (guanine(1835)-N(2))-methyltransferase RlmG [Erwinia persicina]MBD8168159.1 23S rRNA (guanine(1835)-N(2))-methyltransferase RlmG [Erwinia persicina]MCQ4094261.1 23S rRNA (guanine(1835)-N(2))-methyltransferase RlmG [Erwinia persicina]MCQ4101050.1 23S rRNA (guanine(1835)-N(2))-methyltransferase RlmG [Erwinia persicina]
MSQLELSNRMLTLHRFPQMREESPLQAWDAADEYLLQHLGDAPVSGATLIFNDTFGALACALAGEGVYSISDSWLNQQATRQNLALNHLDEGDVQLLDSLSPLPAAPARVLIKVPKTLALLEYQLRALRDVVTPATQIVAAGKAKDIHTSTLQLFEKILGATTTSLARKKARLIYCTFSAPELKADDVIARWQLDGTPYQIHNHANVFSRGGLDVGARFFLQHLPSDLEGEIVDLGCGNGVIGLMALQQNPLSQVHFVDESYMAVASSRMNIEVNCPQDRERSTFHVNNSLAGYPSDRLHAVLCNPPFHQQSAVTDHIAWQMLRDARRCLQDGGELRIVGNRHLDNYHKMKKLFGNCTTVASNQKFVVLRSVKMP